MKIIVDTGAWIAMHDYSDQFSSLAADYYHEIRRKRALLYTNDYALDETYTRLIYDKGLSVAIQFDRQIKSAVKQNQLTILEVDLSTRKQTWKVLKKYKDHKLSFTDGTIVANFKDYRLDTIFTFDKHFKELNLPTNPF